MVTLAQEYISENAKKNPQKPAVCFREHCLTFLELDEQTNRLARLVKKHGVQKGDRVAFCLHKSLDSVISLVSILKADAIYVPLNAQAPHDRMRTMTENAQARVIICDTRTESLVTGLGDIVNLDESREALAVQSGDAMTYANTGENVAYILYTSGSTGKPKGVAIRHSNIINATEWAVDELGITQADRMSQHPPLHFDLSTFDLYCAFKTGATLYLMPEEFSLFPGQILKFMEEHELTIWDSVPSVMVQLWTSGVIHPNRLPKLKKIFFNGEGFPAKFLIEWMKTYPEKMFVNMYGPTETTVQCTFYPIKKIPTDSLKLVPIGKACRNIEVMAVKEDGRHATAGEVGELYVSGAGVGAGYWHDAEKTAAVFVPHPFNPSKGIAYRTGDLVRQRDDGNYEFIGRKDNQVKIRGNRIELGDVDATLTSLPYVKEAATLALPDAQTGGNRLAAFVNAEGEHTATSVKEDLRQHIPPYMIPEEIIFGELPKTSTGKIDRLQLKETYGK